ncbi:MAG: arginase family protein [Chloroflexi bacterium]|nr:arginase family protein [Chloroflexota bacterium]
MKNRFMLTPYFLDEEENGLRSIVADGWMPAAGWTINEPPLTVGTTQERMSQLHRPLADFVRQTSEQGGRPVSLAGDCCTTLGVMAGLQRANINPTLIWLDAHGDFNTWETSPSGFLGGMPLAMLVGRGEQTMADSVRLSPFPEGQIILTDARDLDPGEKDNLDDSALIHLPQAEQLLDYDLPAGPIYVHFDVDVVNLAELPAVSYPAPGGPSAAALRRIFRHLAQTGRVTAVSVSAWNPKLDEDGRSQAIVMELLAELVQ